MVTYLSSWTFETANRLWGLEFQPCLWCEIEEASREYLAYR